MARCHVISCVGCGKKLRRFRASCDIGCLKPRHLHISMSGFQASDVATCLKPSQFFTTAYTCDDMTSRQVSDFVWILYNFKTLFRQVGRHVTRTRCAKFDASSWIGTQHAPINMNNIFRNTTLQYSIHLQFKFDIFEKNQRIEINYGNIQKRQNWPKF